MALHFVSLRWRVQHHWTGDIKTMWAPTTAGRGHEDLASVVPTSPKEKKIRNLKLERNMSAAKHGIAMISYVATGLLAFFILATGGKMTKEVGRFTRREVSSPLSKFTAFSNYYNQYQQLNLALSGYGTATFTGLPCDWAPLAGMASLPVNSNPDFPLYFVTPTILPYFGYATEYTALSAAGVARKMMCLAADVNGTTCNCNLEISYPTPGRFMYKNIFQGTIFKYYTGETFIEVWHNQDGVMYNDDGSFAKPDCVDKASERKSNTKSWRINFANHYMASYVCVDVDIESSDRVQKQGDTFLALTILLALVSGILAFLLQIWSSRSSSYLVAPTTVAKPVANPANSGAK